MLRHANIWEGDIEIQQFNNVVVSIMYQEHFECSLVRNVFFRTYLFHNRLLHNNVFILLVLNFVRQFRHKYGHSKAHNNEFITLVLNMSRRFRHKNVQSKVGKSMFHFIRHFFMLVRFIIFSISHMYIIIRSYGSYFDLKGHIEFQFLITACPLLDIYLLYI